MKSKWQISVYSTTQFFTDEFYSWWISALQSVFGGDGDCFASWVPSKQANEIKKSLDDVTYEQIAKEASEESKDGQRTVVSIGNDNERYRADIVLERIREARLKGVLAERGFVHNEVVLRFDTEYLAIPGTSNAVVRLCEELVARTNPNYLAFHQSVKERPVAWRMGGLSAGLIDIYGLNVFGPPYVELIGMDKIRKFEEVGRVKVLPTGHVLLSLCDDLSEAGSPLTLGLRKRAKEIVGKEFFAMADNEHEDFNRVSNVFQLIGHLWGERKKFQQGAGAASVRPKFDMSGMMLPKN